MIKKDTLFICAFSTISISQPNTSNNRKYRRQWKPINWSILFCNINAISILEKNINKIDWRNLSRNIYAIHLLEKKSFIDWRYLSGNINAISILEKNVDKIDWCELSSYVNAISILEQSMPLERILAHALHFFLLLFQKSDQTCWNGSFNYVEYRVGEVPISLYRATVLTGKYPEDCL